MGPPVTLFSGRKYLLDQTVTDRARQGPTTRIELISVRSVVQLYPGPWYESEAPVTSYAVAGALWCQAERASGASSGVRRPPSPAAPWPKHAPACRSAAPRGADEHGTRLRRSDGGLYQGDR